MDKIEKLKVKQQQFEDLIYKTEQLEKKTFEEMSRFRSELVSLSILQKKSPNNDEIETSLALCSKSFEQCAEMLTDLKEQLHEYSKHRNAIVNCIQEYDITLS